MRDQQDPTSYTAIVRILDNPDALAELTADLKREKRLLAWAYLIDPQFTQKLLAQAPPTCQISVIADHRQRETLQCLHNILPNFTAATWSTNRTLHDKTFLFLDQGLVYIGTHNLTRGSYVMARNRVVRIASDALTQRLAADWQRDWFRARPVRRTLPTPPLNTQ